MLISGFDHVVIAVRDLAAAAKAYETLLGRVATERSRRDGVATALIALDNIAVELMAPDGDSETARRLSATLEEGEGLKSLVFATQDIERLHRRCERVGLFPEPLRFGPPAPARRSLGEGGSSRQDSSAWRSFRADTQHTHGVRLFFLQREAPFPPSQAADASVLGLDHVVVQTADMERAAALYGARLALDMRLDREVRGRRLMFFRCGDAIVEIAHVASRTSDLLWGLSWRVANADAARKRLAAAGLDVSEVRDGMKPGTRVFTVRDGTCNVPTLMIEQAS
jgi:catechol 2,3-dioxygenase-like lactoylglutathione lyase family enzyme